jgi:hypothetical protein
LGRLLLAYSTGSIPEGIHFLLVTVRVAALVFLLIASKSAALIALEREAFATWYAALTQLRSLLAVRPLPD